MTAGERADVEVLLNALREIQQAESGYWGRIAHRALTEWNRRREAPRSVARVCFRGGDDAA